MMSEDSLIELHVMGIALDTRTGTPIVVLNDTDRRRALPIWIGTAEASAIIRNLEAIESPRPMTHDLMQSMIDQLGYRLIRAEIVSIENDTYYANLILESRVGGTISVLDCRPSDAVALTLRTGSPLYASPAVMLEGTVSANQEKDEQENEAFRQFISNLKASDFTFSSDFKADDDDHSEN
jgi:bifunctional DNase/RNase